MKAQSILVTGASGIVGQVLVQNLIKQKYNVTILSNKVNEFYGPQMLIGDLTDYSLLKCLERTEIDSIIHLAASVPHNPKYSAEDNYSITTKIDKNISMLQREKAAHTVYMSTCGLYDRNIRFEKTEQDSTVVYSPYFQAKLEGEELFQANEKSTIVRLSAPIGLRLLDHLVLGKFVKSATLNKSLFIWGQGAREQNFIDCQDVSEMLLKCIEQKPSGVFNCASPKAIDMKSLAELVVKIFGSGKVEIQNTPDPLEGETANYSIAKAKHRLGWSPKLTIAQSLERIKKHVFN